MAQTLSGAKPRRLGASGLTVAPIALGMWRLAEGRRDVAATARLVHAVLGTGITLFDTADIYSFDGKAGFGDAEALLGKVLAAEPGLRARLVLATKGGIRPPLPYDQSQAYLATAIDASLRRLACERIDLWQIHRSDILAYPQETARALDDALAVGKIASVGVSNFTKDQITMLAHFLDCPPSTTQPEISPLRITCFENGELNQAMALDLAVLAWSPLAGGRIAAPQAPREQAVADAFDIVATAQGISRSVVAYSWLMAHPAGIIPIVGTQWAERIAEAAGALAVTWSRQDWYGVLVAARGEPLP